MLSQIIKTTKVTSACLITLSQHQQEASYFYLLNYLFFSFPHTQPLFASYLSSLFFIPFLSHFPLIETLFRLNRTEPTSTTLNKKKITHLYTQHTTLQPSFKPQQIKLVLYIKSSGSIGGLDILRGLLIINWNVKSQNMN